MSYGNSNMELYSAQDFRFKEKRINSLGTLQKKKITLKVKENQAGIRLLYSHIHFKKTTGQHLQNSEEKKIVTKRRLNPEEVLFIFST